jgi:hypothetical protein
MCGCICATNSSATEIGGSRYMGAMREREYDRMEHACIHTSTCI